MEVLRPFRVHGAHIKVFQNVQHFDDDGAPGGRQVGGINIITPVAAMDGFHHPDLITGKVLHTEIAPLCLYRRYDLLRNFAPVKHLFSLGGNQLQAPGQIRVFQNSSSFPGHAVLVQIKGFRSRKTADLAVGVFNVPAGDMRDLKAVLGQADSWLHHLLPAHAAIGIQGVEQPFHLPGHRNGQGADFVGIIFYLAILAYLPFVQGGAGAGHVPEINKHHFPGGGKADGHKAAPAYAGGLLFGNPQGKADGHRRIDGVAPGL